MTSRHPRPVALGLVRHAANASDARRRHLRVAMALRADVEGYALADLFEIDRCGLSEDAALAGLEQVAVRLDAYAVLVSGDVDAARVEEIAARARLVVLRVGEPHLPGPSGHHLP